MTNKPIYKDFLGQTLEVGDYVVAIFSGYGSGFSMAEKRIKSFKSSRIYFEEGGYKQCSDQMIKIPKEVLVERLLEI